MMDDLRWHSPCTTTTRPRSRCASTSACSPAARRRAARSTGSPTYLLDEVGEVSIISEERHEIDSHVEASVHQVRIELAADRVPAEAAAREELERRILERAEHWARLCVAERHVDVDASRLLETAAQRVSVTFESPSGLSRSTPRSCASRSAASWPGTTATSGLSHSGTPGRSGRPISPARQQRLVVGDDDRSGAALLDSIDGVDHRRKRRARGSDREDRPARLRSPQRGRASGRPRSTTRRAAPRAHGSSARSRTTCSS